MGVARHLLTHALQSRHARIGLRDAQLELEGCPPPVGQLDYGVRLKAGVVAVIPHRHGRSIGQRLRVHHEVAHAHVLEHQPERLPIGEKRLLVHAEERHDQGGVGEVALRLHREPFRGSPRRHPARHLFDYIHILQQLEVRGHRSCRRQGLIAARYVREKRLVSCCLPQVSREGKRDAPCQTSVSAVARDAFREQ